MRRIQLKGKTTSLVLTASFLAGSTFLLPAQLTQSAEAQTNLSGSASRSTINSRSQKSYWQKHPKVKSATVGAGVGVAAGAVTGLISKKGVVRGSAIGAGTGAGVGLLQSSKTMKRHPIVKDVLQGTVAGAGLGLAAKKRGKYKSAGKVAATGAAVGLGLGVLKNLN